MLDVVSLHTFYASSLNADSVVIDLGAAAGDFAEAVVDKYGCSAHCVEASSKNFALCISSDRITKHHFAMGGHNGPMELNLMRDGETPWGTIEKFHGRESEGHEDVMGITLDMFLMHIDAPERIALLKVDIEGAEFAMFDVADDDTLRRFDQITVEFHDFMDPNRRKDVIRLIRRLHKLGFAAVKFTRKHHGDVLFLNTHILPVGRFKLYWMRHVSKYLLGIPRLIKRLLHRNGAP